MNLSCQTPRELISSPLDCLPIQGIIHLGGFPKMALAAQQPAAPTFPGTMAAVLHISVIIFLKKDYVIL